MKTHRYIEDFAVGETFETASEIVGEDESIAFAKSWDFQPFHVDAGAAAAHPVFRGLAISGFQTLAITHRLIIARDLGHAWGLVGRGMDTIRWRLPVRPGDTLKVRGEVKAIRHHDGHPAGTLVVELNTLNQHDEIVLTSTASLLVPSRITASSVAA